MATKNELLTRLRVNAAHAKDLLRRAQGVATSITELTGPLPGGIDADTILAETRAMLADVGQSGLDRISQQLDEGMDEVRRIAEQVEMLAERVDNLPAALSESTIELLAQTAGTIDERISELIETATTAFEETRERVTNGIEDIRSRVILLAEKAQNTVQGSLDDLERALTQSRADVERIISTLERTRVAVLAICNTVGIGASSTRPVVETSVSAFSAVS